MRKVCPHHSHWVFGPAVVSHAEADMSTILYSPIIDEPIWIDNMKPSDIGNKIASHTDKIENIEATLRSLTNVSSDIAIIKNDLLWHARIFWLVAVVYAAIFISLFTGLLTWYLPKELNGVRNTSSSTQQTVEELRSQVLVLRAPQSPGPVLSELRTLNQKTFNRALAAVQKVAEQPASHVKPDLSTLQEITYKLRIADENSSDYWPAVLQFIQFASSALTSDNTVPPPGGPFTVMRGTNCDNTTGHCLLISHQTILLDGGNIPNSIFDHCRIKFTQNPVGLSGVKFISCVFEMPITTAPNPYLRNSVKILLASELSKVQFPTT